MQGEYAIAHGDVLATLKDLPDNEFDALLCDPPYGFSFMGKAWDYDVPSVDVWRECLRVLKPGAPLLAFGGARTFHRIACSVEDAGFELRDVLMWLYGKGFPKSQNVSLAIDKAAGATREVVGQGPYASRRPKGIGDSVAHGDYGTQPGHVITAPATAAAAWDGYGTALKPAYEPIILARKPLVGTMVENVRAWGVGGIAIDACRVGDEARFNAPAGNKPGGSSYNLSAVGMPQDVEGRDCVGRWPANLLLDEGAAEALDASVAPTRSVPYRENEAEGNVLALSKRSAGGYADAGGPSRFFYCAKVSTKERELGCEALPQRSGHEIHDRPEDSAGLENPRAGAGRTGGARNHHPTLKPIALTQWLASLVKPPVQPGRPEPQLLIPYSGAGSEVIGALLAGWPLVFGIEGEQEYIDIAHARIAARRGKP